MDYATAGSCLLNDTDTL